MWGWWTRRLPRQNCGSSNAPAGLNRYWLGAFEIEGGTWPYPSSVILLGRPVRKGLGAMALVVFTRRKEGKAQHGDTSDLVREHRDEKQPEPISESTFQRARQRASTLACTTPRQKRA